MALIRDLSKRVLEKPRRHEPTDATWSVFHDAANEVILQIDTYGSDRRRIPGKVSQSVQVDRAGAEKLLASLREAFPDLG